MNDLQWSRAGHDHGAALARDLGFTPVYLHYNSGRHVSANGRGLAGELERLLGAWPQRVERLVLLGHSMGGLVARSAVHHAAAAGLRWPRRLDALVCLGTPHHGAPLERAGHWIDVVLDATPYAAPLARLGQVRSAGITDLRHGILLDDERGAREGLGCGKDARPEVPLPAGARCVAVAATLGEEGTLKGRVLGDGLVPVASALGRHRNPARALAFDDTFVAKHIGHLGLLSDAGVYAQLRRWLGRVG
jgi:pimeloyl-ACP methyl ester carboxylesterase